MISYIDIKVRSPKSLIDDIQLGRQLENMSKILRFHLDFDIEGTLLLEASTPRNWFGLCRYSPTTNTYDVSLTKELLAESGTINLQLREVSQVNNDIIIWKSYPFRGTITKSVNALESLEKLSLDQVILKGIDGANIELQVDTSTNRIQWRLSNELDWTDLIDLSIITGPQGPQGPSTEVRVIHNKIQWKLSNSTEWIDLLSINDIQRGFDIDARSIFFRTTSDKIQWKYSDVDSWHDLIDLESLRGPKGIDGTDGVNGSSVELNTTDTHIQWKLSNSTQWINLIPISELIGPKGDSGPRGSNGKSIELRTHSGYIQWSEVGSDEWNELVSLSTLVGPKGETGAKGLDGVDGTDGKSVALRLSDNLLQWSEKGSDLWNTLINLDTLKGPKGEVGPQGSKGESGSNPVLRYDNSTKSIQWKLVDSHEWNDLISSIELKGDNGKQVVIYKEDQYIKWKYQDDQSGTVLISLSELKGPKGDDGTSFKVKGKYDSLSELRQGVQSPEIGDAYLVGNEIYLWSTVTSDWQSLGQLQGPQGPQGLVGPQGIQGPKGLDGKQVELLKDNSSIKWKYQGDDIWRSLVNLSELKGDKGDEVELRVNEGYIQWKLKTSDLWNNLVETSSLIGPKGDKGNSIELKVHDNSIKWSESGSDNWNQLVSLLELKGDKGDNGSQIELRKTLMNIEWKLVTEEQWKVLLPLSDIKGDKGVSGVNAPEVIAQYSLDNIDWISTPNDRTEYIKFSYNNGQSWSESVKIKGIQGPQGPQGLVGPQGIQGLTGPKGDDGTNGMTAYESAQRGGYSHSESTFYSDLALVRSKVTGNLPIESGNGVKLSYDSKGLVTGKLPLTESDLPNISINKITGLGTSSTVNIGTSQGEIPVIDETGKLPSSVIPAVALTERFVVESESEQLSLNAQEGDIAIRTDEQQTYILGKGDSKLLSSWTKLLTPTSKITSVAGRTGDVVLSKSDVGLSNVDNTSDSTKHVDKSNNDGLGNNITSTYGNSLVVSGDKLRLTSKSGVNLSEVTLTQSHSSTTGKYGLSSATEYGHSKASVTLPNAPTKVAQLGIQVNEFARGDHTHPEQVNIEGNAGTANKLTRPFSLSLQGDASGTVAIDGSSDVKLNVVVRDDSHNHSISNITGLQNVLDSKAPINHGNHFELATKDPKSAGKIAMLGVSTKVAREDHVHPEQVDISGTAEYAKRLVTPLQVNGISLIHDKNNIIPLVGDYVPNSDVDTTPKPNKLLKLDSSGNLPTNITGSSKRLETPRLINLSGGVTGSASFDGSSNVNIITSLGSHTHHHSQITNLSDTYVKQELFKVSNYNLSGKVPVTVANGSTLKFEYKDYFQGRWSDLTGSPLSNSSFKSSVLSIINPQPTVITIQPSQWVGGVFTYTNSSINSKDIEIDPVPHTDPINNSRDEIYKACIVVESFSGSTLKLRCLGKVPTQQVGIRIKVIG